MIVGRARLLGCVGVSFCLLGPAAGAARATALTVSLQYAAGAGCPDAADFKAVVIARLGHDPFSDDAPDHVLVRIAPRDGGKHGGGDDGLDGRIEWRDAGGKWTGEQSFPLIATDCPRLVRAMGFALAVQIQLLENTRAASVPSAPAPTEPDAPAAPPAPPPTPVLPPPTTAPIQTRRAVFDTGAGSSIGLGMSSTPVPLGRLFGAASWPRASIELAAEASLPTITRRTDGAGFSQLHLLASAAACAHVTRWYGCLVVKTGEVRMAGVDVDRSTSAWAPMLEAGARIGFTQRIGRRAFLNARVDGLVNLVRWTASLDNVPVWTAPRLAAVLGIDAGVSLP